jgi:type 1 glutamine amidotransferase
VTGPTALLLSGTGRYADPWHPFAETSAALASLLREAGVQVEVADDVDAALEGLHTSQRGPDLLVVNVGLPRDGGSSPGTAAATRGLESWLAAGGPLLACHVSSTSFVDTPLWEEALGGSWVRGTTMHPDYGPANILMDPQSGPLAAGIPDFEVPDERYSWLRTLPGITVHARHQHEGILHPLMWSYTRDGLGQAGERQDASERKEARTFYDALGHDAASFDSPEHRELLRRAISWLLEGIGEEAS